MILAPWHDELRRFHDPSYHSRETEQVMVWVSIKNKEPVRPYERAVEALCLLSQLARVDLEALRNEMMTIWGGPRLHRWIEANRHRIGTGLQHKQPPLRFGIQVCEFLENTLLPSTQQLPPSAEFTELWGRLAARPSDRQCIDTEVTMVVPMCIEVEGDGCCTNELEWFLTLVKAQQHAAPPPVGALSLRIDALYILPLIDHSLDERDFEIVMEVTTMDIKLRELPEVVAYNTAQASLQMAKGLRALLQLPVVGAHVSSSSHVTGGYIRDDPKHLVPAYMTAVQESLSMRSLRVNLDIDTAGLPFPLRNRLRWNFQLLAYTVLSEHANHHLQLLELDVEHFDVYALSAMVQALEHPDPLALLFSVDDEARNAFAKQIAACQFYLYEQGLTDLERLDAGFSQEQEQAMYESLDPIIVRVIEGPAEDEWWRVLLPGWGCAWVHEDDMMPVAAGDYLPVRASRPSIRSITVLYMSDGSMASVANLLAIIGTGTEHLSVVGVNYDIPGDWCRQVLASCPNLTRLTLSDSSVVDLNVFVNTATEGSSALESLELEKVFPETSTDVEPFFEALCDPNHPLTKHLRVLQIRFYVGASRAALVIKPLQRMLHSNRSLISIDVCFRDLSPDDKVDTEMVAAAFADTVSEVVVLRVGPFSIQQKLAFISAVQYPSSYASLQRLDNHILADIFRYAAQGQARYVDVTDELRD